MNTKTGKIFLRSKKICNKIASLAIEAMLYEVSATPKPGLVDRNNCGAHKDMDFFTFMSSAAALHSVFDEMTGAGMNFEIENLFPELRRIGIEAEKLMFKATNNINTHKGEIFSLGILCGCAGWSTSLSTKVDISHLKAETIADEIMNLAGEVCRGICENDFANLKTKTNLTKGEKIYLEYGIKGIRGEAESGYKTVREISLPVFSRLIEQKFNVNDALVQTLLYLIAETVDTNIISRHDIKTAEYAKNYARKVIDGQKTIEEMDRDFIEKNISPGGCSDLLAVTYFMYHIPKRIFACS